MGEKEEQSTAIHISVSSYFRKVKKQNNISHESTSNQNSFFKKKEISLKQFLNTLKKKKVIEVWIFGYPPLDQELVKYGLRDLASHWFHELSFTGIQPCPLTDVLSVAIFAVPMLWSSCNRDCMAY